MKKTLKLITIIIILIIFSFVFVSLIPVIFSNNDRIFSSLNNIKNEDFQISCLLGARVYPDDELSPVLKQRCNTALKLYNNGLKIPIFISGSGAYEVDNIVNYLLENGFDETLIIKDYLGIDTHDTIRHLNYDGYDNVLFISQSFHLFRAIEMALDEGIDNPVGIASEIIVPVYENIPYKTKLSIRIMRYYKGAILLLTHKIGIYDKISNEAELKEKKINL